MRLSWFFFFDLQVYREDGMPGLICADCRLLMNYSYQFKQMCNDANSQLKAYLSTGVWPNQLSLPKGLANLLVSVQQSTLVSNVPFVGKEQISFVKEEKAQNKTKQLFLT